jgi:hypothetical protein
LADEISAIINFSDKKNYPDIWRTLSTL